MAHLRGRRLKRPQEGRLIVHVHSGRRLRAGLHREHRAVRNIHELDMKQSMPTGLFGIAGQEEIMPFGVEGRYVCAECILRRTRRRQESSSRRVKYAKR